MKNLLRIALMSAAFFSYARIAYAASEAGDTMKVETDEGVCTVTLRFHAEDILAGDGNRCEIFKALIKRASEQAKAATSKRIKELEAEAKAESKAKKMADVVPLPTEIDPNTKLR